MRRGVPAFIECHTDCRRQPRERICHQGVRVIAHKRPWRASSRLRAVTAKQVRREDSTNKNIRYFDIQMMIDAAAGGCHDADNHAINAPRSHSVWASLALSDHIRSCSALTLLARVSWRIICWAVAAPWHLARGASRVNVSSDGIVMRGKGFGSRFSWTKHQMTAGILTQ